MPATGPTYATFGNTTLSRGFRFTLEPGVQPSVCIIETIPHTTGLPSVGTLTIKTEGGLTIAFRECLLEDPKLSASTSGQFWQLPIKDRRWKWQFGAIYGHWNKREANLTYRHEKTPQELASMCFDEMKETAYDVSRLPNTVRPEKRWDGANPAAELDSLCAELSCVVVLNHLTDKAEIWPIGHGAQLPAGGTAGKAYAPVIPALPSAIKVEAAETLFQATFDTEAVGLDTDGKWKKIDDLSYKPAGGWIASDALNGFVGIPETSTYTQNNRTLKVRDLAASTVFRHYRITGVGGFNGRFSPPLLSGTPFEPKSILDLKLFDTLADEEISTVNGGAIPMASVVYARWERADGKPTPISTIRFPDAFSFNGTTGDDNSQNIVTFNEPMFLWDSSNAGSKAAEVHLECSFFAGINGVYHRRSIQASIATASTSTPVSNIQRNDLEARVIYRFDGDGHLVGQDDNLPDTDSKLTYWKDAELTKYGLQQGGTIRYAQLMQIPLDGLTEQITWSKNSKGEATTTVSQAQRHNRFIQPTDDYRDRVNNLRAANFVRQVAFGGLLRTLGGGL